MWPVWAPERLDPAELSAGWEEAFARRGQPGFPATIQLYLHFAFCEKSCRFCQYFHAVPKSADLFARFTDSLVQSLERLRGSTGPRRVSNAYWGGGTPTALPTADLRRVVRTFRASVVVSGEFTCEAHPGNLDEEKLALLAEAGVNRLSMGFQSFDEGVLSHIFRTNPPVARLRDLVRRAREAGIWVNTDLILGLPTQTQASFRADLDEVLFGIRPSCLTVYRYQPTERLNDAPPESMRFSRAIPRATLLRALWEGYLPETGPDDRPGWRFLRVAPFHVTALAQRIAFEATRTFAPGRFARELPTYACFEAVESQLIGLGPGAFSHLYGRAWYRDVESLKNVSGDADAVLMGTRLSPLDEARTAVLADLHARRLIDPRAVARRTGADVESKLEPALVAGVREGTLRRYGRWFVPTKATPPGARAALIEALLPPEPPAAVRRAIASKLDALKPDPEYQPDLLKFFADNLRDSRDGGDDGASSALKEWMQLVGLQGAGESLAGASLLRADESELHFGVRPPPAAPLRVVVAWDRGQNCYFRIGPYAVSYVASKGAAAPEELHFLNGLQAATERAWTESPRPYMQASGEAR